jgi:heat shock protein HspQ
VRKFGGLIADIDPQVADTDPEVADAGAEAAGRSA